MFKSILLLFKRSPNIILRTKVRDGSCHKVNIKNDKYPRFTEGKEQEIIKKTIDMYEEGKTERDIGLAIIIEYHIVCCLTVVFLENEIVIKLY